MGIWRPQDWGDGTVALLLGRNPDEWYGTNPSGQARELVAQGYWAVAVETAWGNQSDLDNIDSAMAWAESMWQRDVSRIVIIAHGQGAVAAMNWSRLHPERVASLSMQAPVVDLETHYVRTPADRAALETAYGGNYSAFLSAMPAWNPSRHQKRYHLRDFMRNRMHIWAAPDETNDEAYIRLPGGASNNVFAIDQDKLDVVGDIDIRWFGAADTWANGGEQTLVSKWTVSGNQRSWKIQLDGSGQLQAQISTDGTAVNTFTSSANPTVLDGQYRGLGFSWVQSTGLLTFYESSDGQNWSQLGTTQNVLAGLSVFNSTSRVEIGAYSNGTAGLFTGDVKRVEVAGETQVEGIIDYSVDFTTKTAGSRYVADDSDQFAWQLRGNAQLLGGHLTERFATAIAAQHDVLSDSEPIAADPAPLVTAAATTETSWTQQLALQQSARWTEYRLDETLTTDWCGADGTHSIPLPDGRVLWTFSDTFTGTVNPDGSRSGAVMINNSIVVEGSDGTLGETVHAVGISGSSLLPPEPGHYYWVNDGVVEQDGGSDVLRLFAYNSEHTGSGWKILHMDLLSVDLNTFEILNIVQRSTEFATWNEFVERPDYTYMYGYKVDWIINRPLLARVATGQVTTGTWEYWDGTGWTTDESQLEFLRDTSNALVEGAGDVIYHDGRYVMSTKVNPLFGDEASFWYSSNPQGPWTKYHQVTLPEQGAERFGAVTTCYGVIFHKHLPALPGHVIVSYNVNGWNAGPGESQGYSINSIDSSIYQARFVEVPLPG